MGGRLFGELLVIIVGVLVALAFDAGWDRLQDRKSESVALESLAQDVAGAESLLRDLMRRDSIMVARADQLLSYSTVPADTFLILVEDLFNTTPIEVRLRTYDELLSTGRVQLLRDRGLRLKLTELDATARTLASYSSQVEMQWAQTARPLLYRSVDWDGLAAVASSGPWGVPGPDYASPSTDSTVELDSEFRAMVRDRRAMVRVRSRWFGEPTMRLLEDLEGLLAR
jgi:hypothetical protein